MGAILAKMGARYLMVLGAFAIIDTATSGYQFSKRTIEWYKNRKAQKVVA